MGIGPDRILRPAVFPGHLGRQPLDDVDEVGAAGVAPAGVALDGLVGQDRALRLQDGEADNVLGGDQFDLILLAAKLSPHGLVNLG